MTVTGEHVREAAAALGVDPEPAAVADEVREWEAALTTITGRLDADATGIDPGDSAAERLLALRRAAVEGRLSVETPGDGDDDGGAVPVEGTDDAASDPTDDDETEPPGARAAARVSEARDPSVRTTEQLLDTLQDGSVAGIEAALERTADAVALADAVDGVDGDGDPSAAADAVTDARAALAEAPDPVAAPFEERLDALARQVDNAADGNPVVPYAVRREATFYAETFAGPFSELSVGDGTVATDGETAGDDAASSATGAEAPPTEATETVERVADRRREITELFVNRREDHSHAIPLLFLSTADDLRERAAQAADDGEAARAIGVAEAALTLLDTVESLYEKNQYSVMLRQLRGS